MGFRRCPATVRRARSRAGESEHLADCGSDTVRGRRWSPTALGPGPTLHSGLNEGHLVSTTTSGRRSAALPGRRSAALSICRVTTALVTTALVTVALAAPAQATAYRYWAYWLGSSGTWVAAQTGAGSHVLVDEDVQGWRFGITTQDPAQGPDNDPDFAALCPQLAQDGPVEGQVRVAVVIDSGFLAEAPDGETPPADEVACVTVPEGSTGNQSLAEAGSITDQGGLVCGINGYPSDECGAPVPDDVAVAAQEAASSEAPNPAVVTVSTAQRTATDDPAGSSSAGLWVAVLAIIALVGSAGLVWRRRARAGA